jgi:N-succinyl-L-ornithine transcarbamylase
MPSQSFVELTLLLRKPMEHFIAAHSVADVNALAQLSLSLKKHPYAFKDLGKNRTMGLIFLNPSLRTRLSSQKAAQNLGMEVMVMNVGSEGWQLEFEDGAIMNGHTAEHVKEAAAVIGSYVDILGIRTFAGLKDREADYSEQIIEKFRQYAGVPVVSLESATRHPLQSLTDLLTIEELKKVEKPKIVLTWAPHPRALPQAVANSFAEWMLAAGHQLTIAHPEGYALNPAFTRGATIVHDQHEAFRDADFIYAKNWSSYDQYGQILSQDPAWTVGPEQMALTNQAYFMHCLPVRRNVVVADDVIDSPQSVVIEQAANRVFACQAVLKTLLEAM